MLNFKNKGFTLIELLVVIAIISLMSSIVLAALNSARAKAANSAVKSQLRSVMSQAAIYYDNNSNYGTVFAGNCSVAVGLFADPNIARIIAAATAVGGGTAVCNSGPAVLPPAPATQYAVIIQLKITEPGSIGYWCVDSSGASKGLQLSTSGTSC